MTENEIAKIIVDCAYKIHSKLGPGLLESAYQTIFLYELKQRGLLVESEVAMPVNYCSIIFDLGYRIDLLVEKKVIIELKIC